MVYFTSSWDDGAVHDIKLAELLFKYDQQATFFIPLNNSEKREVITPKQIADISKHFEIGAHTVNHKFLTTLSNKESEYEIKQSKIELEAIIQLPVYGFCFPGGKYRQIHLEYFEQAGFRYARTVNMFNHANTKNVINTTLQAYNHSKFTYFKHLIKRGYIAEIVQNSADILKCNSWNNLLKTILHKHLDNDSPEKITVIHLWGHSWEIEANDLWRELEIFLKYIKDLQITSKTNYDLWQLSDKVNKN